MNAVDEEGGIRLLWGGGRLLDVEGILNKRDKFFLKTW